MAQKTIPELQEGSAVDTNSLLVFDTGVQTYKITAPNLAQGLRPLATPPVIAEKTALYSPVVAQEGGVIPINSQAGSFNIQLPAPNTMTGKRFTIKDQGGALSLYPVTVLRAAAELFEGIAADFELAANFGTWVIFSDGTNWKLLS